MMNQIKEILKKNKEISFAYLYGSVAKGLSDENSDVDIAVFLRDPTILEKKLFFESEIAIEIEKSINKIVDVRVLNNTSLRFMHQVLKYGKILFSRDEKERITFETQTIDKYLDFKPFLLEYDRIRNKRLLEGNNPNQP